MWAISVEAFGRCSLRFWAFPGSVGSCTLHAPRVSSTEPTMVKIFLEVVTLPRRLFLPQGFNSNSHAANELDLLNFLGLCNFRYCYKEDVEVSIRLPITNRMT
ncbi:hypothetical protein AVEN_222149-1 [Araneus ventricosus]|uniref:Uncharacterized protein n=1 Tax=Araneus ventricosus TaxID=182803 RepID=A0A4Y2UXW3_ARAVE|nr:hypothetical protein AVEN_222149-1 [Araneus ventricosus]